MYPDFPEGDAKTEPALFGHIDYWDAYTQLVCTAWEYAIWKSRELPLICNQRLIFLNSIVLLRTKMLC